MLRCKVMIILEDVARFWKPNPRETSWQRVVKAMKLAAR